VIWTYQLRLIVIAGLACAFSHPCIAQTQAARSSASWSFDEIDGDVAHGVGAGDARLSGIYRHVPGVRGSGIRLDGETSGASVASSQLPKIGPAFSVEGWVAINAYPWNWAPIFDQRVDERQGFLLGIDSFGRPGFQIQVGNSWQFLTSKTPLPLKSWAFVAATFDPAEGMALYVNGSLVAHRTIHGEFKQATDQDLLIGRVRYPMLPAQWLHPKFKVMYSFDGILDEIKITNAVKTAAEIQREYVDAHVTVKDVMTYPQLPSGPPGVGPFGGYYATLKYDELWDAPRRVGPASDVVVRFDQMPIRLVSWQGTNYIPAWVTENGKWYTDEFVETGGLPGCPLGMDCEPMSDKQNSYAHVRVLESTPARTVIHFRYGQCEVEQSVCANPDPETGWTDWADDYYTVYPDGVAARKTVAWTSNFSTWHEFQETIIINPPGTRPEDNIETKALTLLNMKGESATYSWDQPPTVIDKPSNANIQLVNLKSAWKPFQIVSDVKPQVSAYIGEKTYSMFEWWNHWPVAEVKSSGISAVAADRPSHSSLSHIESPPVEQTGDSITKIMLDGLTNQPASNLVKLASSWIHPAPIILNGGSFHSSGYDAGQRAYVVKRDGKVDRAHLQFSLKADERSPLVNPCIVVEGWGESEPELKIDGKPVGWGSEARYGLVPTVDGSKLVVWLKLDSAKPIDISLEPSTKN
jgi:hypothetical protein